MKRWPISIALLVSTLLMMSCTKKSADTPAQTAGDHLNDAQTADRDAAATHEAIRLDEVVVHTAWLARYLDHPDLVTLHIGDDRDAWTQAHLPGQVYIPFGDIVVGSMEEGFDLPDLDTLRGVFEAAGVGDDRVVVLTGDMDGLMASRAFYSLEVLGLKGRVAVLNGGVQQWKDEERPLVQEIVEPRPGKITADVDRTIVVDASDVASLLENPRYQLVDARPNEEFTGQTPGKSIARGGHIPRAINIFWKDTLVQKDRPLIVAIDELKAHYADAGVKEDTTIVAYCRTGMQGSFGYLLARMQGRDAKLYDGSYLDWSSDPARPVSTGEMSAD